eukprot:CAMPEP_0184345316 /NCGR_PEP_ID=MMETSP1089-20130417/13740_1 /TAXON_ID=38269 ORGANISM="Gloeochaete wittrockiana, Strain SAG46.84" /NCGR_SAMPLE_ID=MMETSP1089 /ASSEMBLY_ACC=CAM_ASM_000445 /LENGTH=761 /DNA_ID=CAMNT_0026675567 /DNA_START=195 /DNA_END=2477 /DNA_ORIENTATION=-
MSEASPLSCWSYGEIFRRDSVGKYAELFRAIQINANGQVTHEAECDLLTSTSNYRAPIDEDSPGRVMSRGVPEWYSPLSECSPEEFSRCHEAVRMGFQTAAAFPIVSSPENSLVQSVIMLFSTHLIPNDCSLLETTHRSVRSVFLEQPVPSESSALSVKRDSMEMLFSLPGDTHGSESMSFNDTEMPIVIKEEPTFIRTSANPPLASPLSSPKHSSPSSSSPPSSFPSLPQPINASLFSSSSSLVTPFTTLPYPNSTLPFPFNIGRSRPGSDQPSNHSFPLSSNLNLASLPPFNSNLLHPSNQNSSSSSASSSSLSSSNQNQQQPFFPFNFAGLLSHQQLQQQVHPGMSNYSGPMAWQHLDPRPIFPRSNSSHLIGSSSSSPLTMPFMHNNNLSLKLNPFLRSSSSSSLLSPFPNNNNNTHNNNINSFSSASSTSTSSPLCLSLASDVSMMGAPSGPGQHQASSSSSSSFDMINNTIKFEPVQSAAGTSASSSHPPTSSSSSSPAPKDKQVTSKARSRCVGRRLTLENLRPYFTMSLVDAARELGMGVTTLKSRCRLLGINNWPYAKMYKDINLTPDAISSHFHLRENDAAKALGVSLSTLKKTCRRFGMSQWPKKGMLNNAGALCYAPPTDRPISSPNVVDLESTPNSSSPSPPTNNSDEDNSSGATHDVTTTTTTITPALNDALLLSEFSEQQTRFQNQLTLPSPPTYYGALGGLYSSGTALSGASSPLVSISIPDPNWGPLLRESGAPLKEKPSSGSN